MKAVQFTQYGGPEVLSYQDMAKPTPGAGEILIKVESASVNWSDVAHRSNAPYPFPTPLPFIPGNEVAGIVEALGAGVAGPAVGTPVFALVGNGSDGYAQYAVTPAYQVIPIPPGVSPDVAASLPVAGTTAMLILHEVAKLQPGETILIQGAAGGVGNYAIQIAKMIGAGLIIGADERNDKGTGDTRSGRGSGSGLYTGRMAGARARTHSGARCGCHPRNEWRSDLRAGLELPCPVRALRRLWNRQRAAARLRRRFDSALFLQPGAQPDNPRLQPGAVVRGCALSGAGKAMGDLIGAVASGQIRVNVNHVLPLSQAAEAHRMIEERRTTGKIVLKPWLNV